MKKKSEDSPVSAFTIVIIFALFMFIGAVISPMLSIQLLPNKTYSSITIRANLPGASTEITDLELTSPIEAALSRLNGITNIYSVSDKGKCHIRIQLDKWTDPEIFRFEASSIIRLIHPKLPAHSTYPHISLNQPEDQKKNQPLLSFAISGPGTANEVADFADQELRGLFANVEGIHRLEIVGDKPIYQTIIPDAVKMKSIGLTFSNLQDQISQGFTNIELGRSKTESEQIVVYLNKAINTYQNLLAWPIHNADNRLFRLSDLATITQISPSQDYIYRINGQEKIILNFYPQEHINTIKLASKIKQKLSNFSESTDRYFIQLQIDQTEYIKNELGKIYKRTGLSVFILLFFVVVITRNFRYVLIVTVALLANILISIICYHLLNLDIHLYSLAGVTISLGLVIDNVIVIVEDIRHTKRNRIFTAILASNITAIGALSVIFFLEESQKLQLLDFAIAIIVNLVISLPIAYFFIPAVLELFPIKIKKKRFLYARRRKIVALTYFHTKQLNFLISHKWIIILFCVLLFGLPTFLLPNRLEENGNPWNETYNKTFGSSFYNQHLRDRINTVFGGVLYQYITDSDSFSQLKDNIEEETQLFIEIGMPEGTHISHMDSVCSEFESILKNFKNEVSVFTTDVPTPSSGRLRVLFNKDVKAYVPHQLKLLFERQAVLSGSADFSIYGVGKGFNNSLTLDKFDSALTIRGYNYQQLQALAMIVRDSLLQYKRVNEVMLSSQREWGQNINFEHTMRFNTPEKLMLYKVGKRKLESVISSIEERSYPVGTYFNENMNPINVQLQNNYENVPTIWEVTNLPYRINDSTDAKFSLISELMKVRVGRKMIRENQEYIIFINYRLVGTYKLNKVISENIVAAITPLLPFGYKIEDTDFKTWKDENSGYLWFIFLVIGIIYMICSILLESLFQPLSIIAIIPFSFIGVFLIFKLLGLQFNDGGYAALLMLSGLVTNAGLYILNDLNSIRSSRNINIKSFVQAYNAKAMPILITTIAAILSLLPFMLDGGDNGFWFSLSAGTIGGLVFSLLGAYLLLPVLLIPRNSINPRK